MIGLALAATACSSTSASSSASPGTSTAKPASPAQPVTSFLHQLGGLAQVASTPPLGMTMAPNGDLVVLNGNNGNAVEITPAGKQVTAKTLIKNGAGDLFGIITAPGGDGLIIANDGTNALDEANM